MKEIPTVKVIDPDCEGGFRIINESDLTPDDKPFVEKAAQQASKPSVGDTVTLPGSDEVLTITQEVTQSAPEATVAKAPRIRNRSKK